MIKGISLQDHRIIKEQIVHSASDKLHNVVNRTVLKIRLVCPSEGAIRRKYSAEVLAQELERVQQSKIVGPPSRSSNRKMTFGRPVHAVFH